MSEQEKIPGSGPGGSSAPADDPRPLSSETPQDAADAEPNPDEELDHPQGGTSVVGFILIPLVIVLIAVGIVWTFMMLAEDRRTVQDYAEQIRSDNKSERWQAVLDLVSSNRGSPDLVPILINMVEATPEEQELVQTGWDTTDLLKTPEERRINLRWYATAALGNIGGEQAEAKLVELLDDPDGGVRLYAVHGLARTGNTGYIPAIIHRLNTDEDAGVRAVAAYALGEVGDERGREPLLEAFRSDPATDVQWNAAIALARFGEQEARPMLDLMIQQGDPQVRTQARKALTTLDQALVTGGPQRKAADLDVDPVATE